MDTNSGDITFTLADTTTNAGSISSNIIEIKREDGTTYREVTLPGRGNTTAVVRAAPPGTYSATYVHVSATGMSPPKTIASIVVPVRGIALFPPVENLQSTKGGSGYVQSHDATWDAPIGRVPTSYNTWEAGDSSIGATALRRSNHLVLVSSPGWSSTLRVIAVYSGDRGQAGWSPVRSITKTFGTITAAAPGQPGALTLTPSATTPGTLNIAVANADIADDYEIIVYDGTQPIRVAPGAFVSPFRGFNIPNLPTGRLLTVEVRQVDTTTGQVGPVRRGTVTLGTPAPNPEVTEIPIPRPISIVSSGLDTNIRTSWIQLSGGAVPGSTHAEWRLFQDGVTEILDNGVLTAAQAGAFQNYPRDTHARNASELQLFQESAKGHGGVVYVLGLAVLQVPDG